MIEITDYRRANLYLSEDGVERIDCEIDHPRFGWIPTTLAENDPGSPINNVELMERIKEEGNYEDNRDPNTPWNIERKSNMVRMIRDTKLSMFVDPLVTNPLRWAELSDEKKEIITKYRQDLLDISKQPGFPNEVEWPDDPVI